ncbi:MAG: alpha/beta hydrolase [Firmicutes bacterium]|nr:alpha/beta hydrolase [Bacillota bacterium]
MGKSLEEVKKKVDELEVVNIGGIDQYILQRGDNRENPLILFLHGGPGNGQIGYMSDYQKELEKHFIVVNWDQRGAGLSYSDNIKKESMNIEQFINDTFEVTNYLKTKFNKEKLYLMGHSWGSLLGMKVIDKYPELFYKYIGIGQVADMWEGEKICYDYVKKMASKENNKLAIQELNEIDPPPYDNSLECIQVIRKWVSEYDGTMKNGELVPTMYKGMKNSKYYNDEDIEKWEKGGAFSAINMLDEILESSLFKEIKRVKIPVIFFGGKHDYTTPQKIAFKYLQKLKAPYKEFIWFENSAHMPMIEECEKFEKEVIKAFKN